MITISNITNKFEYRHGDIFNQNDLDYIAHQCNCFHCMGGGVAYVVAKKYPQAVIADKNTSFGKKDKLGTISIVNTDSPIGIINMYSQFEPGCFIDENDYNERLTAIKNCLNQIKDFFSRIDKEVHIGFPYLIGCGISGLNEEDVMNIFNEVFESNKESNIKIIFVDFNNTFDIYEQMEFDWNEERNDAQIESISNF